jgi:hypothetical protein
MSANDRQGGAVGLCRTRWLPEEEERGIQPFPESFGLWAHDGVMWIGEIGIKADRRVLEKGLDIRPQELPLHAAATSSTISALLAGSGGTVPS